MNVHSVKDRLKNYAKKSGKTMQDTYVLYGLERSLYRLSVSEYAEIFTLKGGIFLYAIFDGDFVRATKDVDLLANHISNDTDKIGDIFKEIFSIECDDALIYDLKTLDVQTITEFKDYHGVRVSVMSYLDRTKIPISIDIGFDDVVYPERVIIEFPTILEMASPKLFGYTVVTAIAEKFEAIVSLGLANSRYKDFYDICVLASDYNFDGRELQLAIIQTFQHRGTSFDDIAAFENDFMRDPVRKNRWQSFIRKKRAMKDIGFEETIGLIIKFLMPIINATKKHNDFEAFWSKDDLSWHK